MSQTPRFTTRILTFWTAWAASRVSILLLLGVAPAQAHAISDVRLYARWYSDSLSHGHAPHDAQWNYPPGAGVSLWLAGLITPYVVGLLVLLLAADIAIVRVIRRRAQDSWGPIFWVVAPLLLGPVVLARFDLIPSAFAVAGLVAGPLAAGFLLATGALVKAWPVVLLALRAANASASQLRRLTAGALVSAAGLAGVLAATHQWGSLTSWMTGNGSRGLQIESVAASPWVLMRVLGVHVEAPFNHGSVQVVGTGTAITATVCSILGLIVVAAGLIARRRGADLLTVAAAVVLCLTVTAKVLSPQYLLWSMALVALTRSRQAMVLLGSAALLTQAVFPTTYTSFINGEQVSTAIMLTRNVLLLACAASLIRDVVRSMRAEVVDDQQLFLARAIADAREHQLPLQRRPLLPQPRNRPSSVVASDAQVHSRSTHSLPAAPSRPAS